MCALAVPLLIGCGRKERRFESVCQIVRRQVVETDEHGVATQIDLELEWDPCPEDQYQMVRGGAEFARCIARYHDGDAVPVRVSHWWDERGYFTWDVYQVGDCRRPIEVNSEGSFERSQECQDTASYGLGNGYVCNRRPFRRLVNVCPWMARH